MSTSGPFIEAARAENHKPYEFRGIGAMDVPKPYKFIGFGAMDVPKTYEFGAMLASTCFLSTGVV